MAAQERMFTARHALMLAGGCVVTALVAMLHRPVGTQAPSVAAATLPAGQVEEAAAASAPKPVSALELLENEELNAPPRTTPTAGAGSLLSADEPQGVTTDASQPVPSSPALAPSEPVEPPSGQVPVAAEAVKSL